MLKTPNIKIISILMIIIFLNFTFSGCSGTAQKKLIYSSDPIKMIEEKARTKEQVKVVFYENDEKVTRQGMFQKSDKEGYAKLYPWNESAHNYTRHMYIPLEDIVAVYSIERTAKNYPYNEGIAVGCIVAGGILLLIVAAMLSGLSEGISSAGY